MIGNLRELAGLDRLSFGGQASAVTVAGGRYITDNVYLEVIGGGEGGTEERPTLARPLTARVRPMRILTTDQAVLDHVAARREAIIGRTIDWANINSGSRNAAGLNAVLDALEAVARALPGAVVERIATQGSTTVADDGSVRTEAHADALKITARPEAPIQVVLTGHYDTVFPADSRFQTVTTRADGALNGPGVADMKGGISVLLAALDAFETHPEKHGVGWTVLLSPDEEIGSPASAPLRQTANV